MTALRIILIDQLSHSLSCLNDCAPEDIIFMGEFMEDATNIPHHPKKLAFQYAAQRHFAEELKQKGFTVHYSELKDPKNTGSLTSEVARILQGIQAPSIIMTEPSEYNIKKTVESWSSLFQRPVDIRTDDRFLCSIPDFQKWAKDKKQYRMEFFYREMRKKYNILMEPDGTPTGGQWNYDKDNRKPPKHGLTSPKRIRHPKSDILKQVLTLVEEAFPNHFGDLHPFYFAVTRDQALIELDDFIDRLLPHFGDYQDAMVLGEAYLNHSLLSTYINGGLLLPLEICQKAEAAYRSGRVPLNSAEGFIRQVLGWREYVRGIYWLKMPEYGDLNFFETNTPLPPLYWGEKTGMTCVQEAVSHTRVHAYSHHIQRLMVTGNFALLAGLDVREVQEWYLAVYSDAYEWVEMPNTLGMALYGDGGILGSKPYAASGKYIHKMSNFCKKCKYDPEEMTGDRACPFNALYWDFLVRNRSKLEGNQRLPYVYSTWDKFTPSRQEGIRSQAHETLKRMGEGTL